MNSNNKRDVYLPEGSWINFFTGERHNGGKWIKGMEVPLEIMPVFVRENAVIPIYPEHVECTDEMDMTKVKQLFIDETFKGISLQ